MSASEGNRLTGVSLTLRESGLKRLRLVPEGYENWQIAPGQMSFADLAQHLIDADQWLFKKLEVETLGRMVAGPGLVSIQQRDEYVTLLDKLEQTGQQRPALLRQMTEARLGKTMFDERFGKDVTIWWIVVRGSLDHEAHHRAQIAAYLAAVEKKH